ncbi:MAG TPA: hypothetical protein VFP12_03765 [Allosphingosinicella sp.]|nr:hypothetical protein [Allosphingosinicella sp.]
MQRPFVESIYATVTEVAIPLVIVIAAVSLLTWLAMRFTIRGQVSKFLPFVIALACLGAVPGEVAGASFEPIVGAMLTGLLGIVSALLAYLFSKDSLQEWRPVIPFALIAMLICALGGLTIGGIRKAQFDQFDREWAIYRSELENLSFPVEKEERLIHIRRKYGEPGTKPDATRSEPRPSTGK